MKRYVIILAVAFFAVSACGDQNNKVQEDFDKLMTQNDSIEKVQSTFENTHQEMTQEYEELSQRLEGGEVQDTTMLENLAKKEVILKNHETWMSSHKDMISAHSELRSDFNNMSDAEKQAQISKMKSDHQSIMSEHETMRSDHDQMKKDFEDMRKKLNDTTQTNSESM